MSTRSNHQGKSIAQSSSWCSPSSQDLEGLVELQNVFEEDEGRESSWLNISIEVSDVSQKVDCVSKISESSVVEGFSFTGNNVSSVGSTSNVCGEDEWFTDNE